MLKNHLISAVRNLIKHKGFSFIHIGGLAIGLTTGIFVIHYARIENSYDLFHQNVDQIYRVITARVKNGIEQTTFATTYAGAGPAMKGEYPAVESYTRLFHRSRGGIISFGDTRFREKRIYHADSGFFKVFSFPILAGEASDLLRPGIAFVEAATAKKYFGNEDPIGKRITFGSVNGIEEYEIRGVLECPESSSIKFTFIFSYHDLGRIFGTEHLSNWTWLDFHTFIKLKKGVDSPDFESHLPDLLKKFRGDRASSSRLSLQSFPSIYLQSNTEFETGITGNISTVRVLLGLGIVIIIMVWLNFVNLSTSRALARAKEVGIRKVLGSSRQNLVLQFLIEAGMTTLIAGIICCLLLWIALPYFNQLTGKQIEFGHFVNQHLWKYLTAFLLLGTLAIGIYPALQISSFMPVDVLKGFFSPKRQGAFLREAFVGFQALVSFSLVASILIVKDQLSFVNSRELKIDIDNVLVVRTPEVMIHREEYISSLNSYKAELLKDARILKVATTVDSPGEQVDWIGALRMPGADPSEAISSFRAIIDEDFPETMGVKIIAGQSFRSDQSIHDILLNQTCVKALGFENNEMSIGQRLLVSLDTCIVVGVVEDFHQVSPRDKIAPTVFHYNLEIPRMFLIKYNSHDAKEAVQLTQQAFQKLFPNEPFDYYFLSEFYDHQYASERKLTAIIAVFCGFAVFVSSLGLLGLTWFRISRQKKELAIRKIIGSTNLQLFYDASRRLFLTILVGCVLAIPITWFVMTEWLHGFATHTQPKVWQFVAALITSFVIALLTISGYTMKIVRMNPAHHLKQD